MDMAFNFLCVEVTECADGCCGTSMTLEPCRHDSCIGVCTVGRVGLEMVRGFFFVIARVYGMSSASAWFGLRIEYALRMYPAEVHAGCVRDRPSASSCLRWCKAIYGAFETMCWNLTYLQVGAF